MCFINIPGCFFRLSINPNIFYIKIYIYTMFYNLIKLYEDKYEAAVHHHFIDLPDDYLLCRSCIGYNAG
jgi:hypothetical protein